MKWALDITQSDIWRLARGETNMSRTTSSSMEDMSFGAPSPSSTSDRAEAMGGKSLPGASVDSSKAINNGSIERSGSSVVEHRTQVIPSVDRLNCIVPQ